MRFVTVVGARPQFIKCAPLSRVLRENHDEILVHTGQHYDFDMSRIFFDELNIPEPDYNLEVGSGSHGHQTAKILAAVEDVMVKEAPDAVIVFGDTNSTLAGALAAAKLNIPLAHVEAGLRSYDRTMPEEINRVLTDHASNVLFSPTKGATSNLRKEGIVKGVHTVGDVMVDALESARGAMGRSDVIGRLGLSNKRFILLTVHRPTNTDFPENLRNILRAISRSGEKTVFPVHPRTRKALQSAGIAEHLPENLTMIAPVGYVDSLALTASAKAVITDSGGMQKEAFLLGTRCITLRDTTEWPETLVGGMNTLVGAEERKILAALGRKQAKPTTAMPFGKPGAARRMLAVLESDAP